MNNRCEFIPDKFTNYTRFCVGMSLQSYLYLKLIKLLILSYYFLDQPTRNEKYLACVAAGKWVLHRSYMDKCEEAKLFVQVWIYFWKNMFPLFFIESTPFQKVFFFYIFFLVPLLTGDWCDNVYTFIWSWSTSYYQ